MEKKKIKFLIPIEKADHAYLFNSIIRKSDAFSYNLVELKEYGVLNQLMI